MRLLSLLMILNIAALSYSMASGDTDFRPAFGVEGLIRCVKMSIEEEIRINRDGQL